MRKKLILVLLAGAAGVGLFVGVRAYIRGFEANMMEHKRARITTGVILEKKQVKFGPDQTEYQNDEGRTVHVEGWRRKSGELRIFYRIDNFDQIPLPDRSNVVTNEQERAKRFGARFQIVDQRTFDQAAIGQTVNVTYRWTTDSNVEIISFQLAGQRSDGKL